MQVITRRNFNISTNGLFQSSVYLERPRVNKLLEDALNYPLVAVCAGSGYGKTRCVYSFLQKYDGYTTWLQITERDNAETRFWESLVHMISISWPQTGDRLMEIGFPDSDEAFSKFEAMMREAGEIPGKHIMVYDDFHLLVNPAVLRFLKKAFKVLPQSSTVILITRVMPDINMVTMLMHERIFTINEDALRFSAEEIIEYFNLLDLRVDSQDIQDIYNDTQGWAFAINLIGRSLGKDRKYERYAPQALKNNVYKLIDAEVSQIVSKPLWRFVLRISLIDCLAASLVNALTDDHNLINDLTLLNAYVRYDPFQDAYVIHHLFLDYLRQRQDELSGEEKRRTYQTAGYWCEQNNYQTDALAYYEKSGDWDSVIRIVYSFDSQVPQNIAKYVLDIFNRIPKVAAEANPMFPAMLLKLKIGDGLLGEASMLAERYAIEYEALPESPEKNRALLGIYYVWGLLRLVMCPYTGKYDFHNYFMRASEYGSKSPYKEYGSATNQSMGTWVVIAGEARAGAPDEFIEAISRSIPYVSRALSGNMSGFDNLARGELCFYRREIDEAQSQLNIALDKARSWNQYDIQNRALFYLMSIAFYKGDYEAAGLILESMKELLDKKDYLIRHTTYDVACAIYYLNLDQAERVPAWLKGDFAKNTNAALFENYANRAKVIYHYQTRQYNALLAFTETERPRQATLFGKATLEIIAALSNYHLKRRGPAIAALTRAYEYAEPNKLINMFIKYGKDMRTLTAAAAKDSACPIPKAWLEDINRKSSAFAKKQARMISEYKKANNISNEITLTAREAGILTDIAGGLSRSEVAASRNLSVNTVKVAINIIYEKLKADSLADAIRVAVERKLI